MLSKVYRRLLTTNMSERVRQEVHRRERVIRIVPNDASAPWMIGAVLAEQHEAWVDGRRYFDVEAYRSWRRAQVEPSDDVAEFALSAAWTHVCPGPTGSAYTALLALDPSADGLRLRVSLLKTILRNRKVNQIMGRILTADDLDEALGAVGSLPSAEGARASIVVVGGASLSLLGLVRRTTRDVNVIALVSDDGEGASGEGVLVPPEPLPEPLVRAVHTVARDFGLPAGWMNTDVALQWHSGLPPGLADELTWRGYEALRVGLVGRRALIALKLFAAVDGGPSGVHFQDLLALHPTDEDLEEAAVWVRRQDASDVFLQMVDEVAQRVHERRRAR